MTDPNKKNKKNKNKQTQNQAQPKDALSSILSNSLDTSSLLSKFNELLSQEKEIDFEKFDACEKNVRAEMENIQAVLTKIQQNKFEDFPDEEKKEPAPSQPSSNPQLDAHRKKLLGELNKKIEIFEDKIARLDAIPTEIDADPRLLPILQGLKENLQDDARRNRDLYRKFEIH